ncbi:hypothetical protein V8C35DRAFT_306104 [Trichoderma chlorosporum]
MDWDELVVIGDKFLAEITDPSHKDVFRLSSYEDVLHDINSIQSIRESTKNMINMKRIHPFLTGMEHFEKTLIKSEFPNVAKAMACIWGPVRFLLEVANRTDRDMDNLLDVYERIGNKLPLLYNYVRLFISIPDSGSFLVHIYQDVVTFHQAAYNLYSLRTTLLQKISRTTWKALSDTFDHLTNCLERHTEFLKLTGLPFYTPQEEIDTNVELTLVEFCSNNNQNPEDLRRMFLEYVGNVKRSREAFEDKQTAEMRDTREKVLTWISASKKTELLHKRFQETRVCADTGRWLFKKYSEISDWMKEDTPPDSAIWLHGDRGFGKTILASLLVDELKELPTQKKKNAIPEDSKICYFYCQEEDPYHRTYIAILKGVLHQLVESNDYLLPFCKENIDSSGNLSDVATAEALIKAFFEYNNRQYVIVDGLDRCELIEANKIATFFMEQVSKCDNDIKQGRLRVLFMSQLTPELAKIKAMPDDGARVKLKSKDNAEDIRAYVKKRITDFSDERATGSGFNLSQDDKDQIESIICHRSEEMFLYAHLAIEYLLQQPTKAQLKEKMAEEMTPKELSQIYEKLLGNVESELRKLTDGEAHWDMAKLLLGWLTCANRPLRWHEMQSILSYDPKQQKVDFDNKMLRQDCNKYLGSLVHVLKGGHIQIIHSTARSYIIQNKYINEQSVQCDLAVLCLRYLCLISDSGYYDENKRREKVKLGWFSFQDYACSQWHGHIRAVIMKCHDIFYDNSCGQRYRETFGSALQQFLNQHHQDLIVDHHHDAFRKMPELAKFSALPFYQNLCTVWNHIYTHESSSFDDRNNIGIECIQRAMMENRTALEAHFAPGDYTCLKDTIADYYGPNLFKCKRLLCDFFYLGYEKRENRDAHNNRHERPHQCPSQCNAAPIGFSSKKDLERHVRLYHPDLNDGLSGFALLRPRNGTGKFPCSLCGKSFTRKITQIGHERSHFGERPYKCPQVYCDKAFTRLSDCRRHQSIHLRDTER